MGRKKKLQPDNPEQSAKFIEIAEKLELVDNPEKAFEDALKRIGQASRKTGGEKPLSEKPV